MTFLPLKHVRSVLGVMCFFLFMFFIKFSLQFMLGLSYLKLNLIITLVSFRDAPMVQFPHGLNKLVSFPKIAHYRLFASDFKQLTLSKVTIIGVGNCFTDSEFQSV